MSSVSKEKFFEIFGQGREDNKWDFKQNLSVTDKGEFYEFLKDVLAFSNSSGGYLLLGIQDKTKGLIGVQSKIDEAGIGEKIEMALGYNIALEILYFQHEENGNNIDLGIIYIPASDKIRVSNKDYNSPKGGIIIQSNVIYVRRNTRSVKANGEDLERLQNKKVKGKEYTYSEHDLRIIERNKSFIHDYSQLTDYLKGKYSFSAINFGLKLEQIYIEQLKYNKLEFASLIGLEEEKINDYFEGKALPKLEHILRACLIFDLPTDFFFQPTYRLRYPIWKKPMISYCIVEKVTNKNQLFKMDEGEFFYKVFYELGNQMHLFHEWLEHDPYTEDEDDIFSLKPKYAFLDESVSKLPKDKIEKYKASLSRQYYKVLEVAEYADRRDKELLPSEKIIQYLLGSNDEFICRIINESISEIIIHENSIEVKCLFIEEVRELIIRGRSYNSETVSIELGDAKNLL